MELRHLRYFVAVAENGGFSKSARNLFVSQSALSEQIADLEREIGVQLFDRSRRRLTLTAHGELFLHEARRALNAAQHAVNVAKSSAAGHIGELRIGFFTGSVGPAFPRLIRRFRQTHPQVRVSLTEMIPSLQWKALLDGALDVGITRRLEPPFDVQLRSERLRQDPLLAVLPRNHPLAPGPIDVRALSHEPFVLCDRRTSPALFDKIIELCSDSGFSPQIANTSAVWSSIALLVQAGEGISILPSNHLQELSRTDLVFCPLRRPATIDLVMAWSPRRETPILQHFQQLVRETSGRL